jgi:RNA polymerase sigma-70 factor (ECF subfamily)
MSEYSDNELIDRVIAGDTDAFTDIVKRYQNKIFRYIYTRVYNYDEACDMTQDVFVITMESLKTFRRESQFSTWLFSIAVNYCKNYRRKNRHKIYSIYNADNEMEFQIPDLRQNQEELAITNESMQILLEELHKLPDDYRDILILRDIEGESYTTIAQALQLTLANVKVRIHRGREMLKSRLGKRGLI